MMNFPGGSLILKNPLISLLLLDLVGWILFLSGTASMQSGCGDAQPNVTSLGGLAGYNTVVACDNFFAYTWWFVFYNLAFLIAAGITIKMKALKKFRPGLIGLATIAVMQSTIAANTYVSFTTFDTTSVFKSRAQVTIAGACIKAIVGILFIGVVGYRDESKTWIEDNPPEVPETSAAATEQ